MIIASLQAGAQSYGYAVFLMTDKAVKYIHDTAGWEIGVGPTVVVVDEGVARNLSTTTLKDDAYAFIFDQSGLMAGVTIVANTDLVQAASRDGLTMANFWDASAPITNDPS